MPTEPYRTCEVELVEVFSAAGRRRRDTGSVSCSGAIESVTNDAYDPKPSAFVGGVGREGSYWGVLGRATG